MLYKLVKVCKKQSIHRLTGEKITQRALCLVNTYALVVPEELFGLGQVGMCCVNLEDFKLFFSETNVD